MCMKKSAGVYGWRKIKPAQFTEGEAAFKQSLAGDEEATEVEAASTTQPAATAPSQESVLAPAPE